MKKSAVFGLALSFFTMGLTATAFAQIASVFDTVYVPPGYPDGPGTATIFVPTIGNGVGVVLVHGATQSRQALRTWCDTLASYGYVAMTIDYPDPELTPSAVYPKKTRAVKLAVEFLRRNAVRFGITTGKIVGWGHSLGAGTWGEAIIWDNDDAYFQTDPSVDDHLNAAVLFYGYYEAYYGHAPQDSALWNSYFSDNPLNANKGSCIKHIGNITTPVLLLHGTTDGTVPYSQSVMLHDSLVARGKMSELIPFSDQPHGFDLNYGDGGTPFTAAGLIAKDSALAFLRRIVAPPLKIHLNTPSIDFGNVPIAENDTATAGMSNVGFGSLNVYSIVNAGTQFSLLNLPAFPAVIPEGGSLQFKAAFHPSVQGVSQDTIRIVTNDSLHQLVMITLRAKGVAAIRPASPGVVYATSGAAPEGYLYTLNTLTGAVSTIGSIGTPEMQGMAIRHSDNIIYGSYTAPTTTTIYRISSVSGDAVRARVLPVGNLRAIAFSPGDTLYGATTTGSLYRIDLETGQTDSVGTSHGLAYRGLSFRPRQNQLWASVTTPIDSIFTLNTSTGAATFVGVTGFGALTNSLAFDARGNLFALIDNGSGEDYLASIDTLTASGSITAGPLLVTNLRAIAMRTDALGPDDVKVLHDKSIPLRFAMDQNFPNPFNPSTTIRFSLPHHSHVIITVTNLLGQRVTELANGDIDAGYHEIQFNATNLASGVYFYHLQAGSFVETKRLIVLR